MPLISYDIKTLRANIGLLGNTVGRHEFNGVAAYGRPRLVATPQGLRYGEADSLHRQLVPANINMSGRLIARCGGYVDRAPQGRLVFHCLGLVVGDGGDLYDVDVDVDEPDTLDLDVKLKVSQLVDGDANWSGASNTIEVTDTWTVPHYTYRKNSPYRLLQLLKASDGAAVAFDGLDQHGRFDQFTEQDANMFRLLSLDTLLTGIDDRYPIRVELTTNAAISSSVATGAFYAMTSSVYWMDS